MRISVAVLLVLALVGCAPNTDAAYKNCHDTLSLSVTLDDNLTFVRERLLHSEAPLPEVLQTYGRVRSGDLMAAEAAPAVLTVLQMAGIVAMAEGRLRVRNRIYEQVFNQAWLKRVSPQIEI